MTSPLAKMLAQGVAPVKGPDGKAPPAVKVPLPGKDAPKLGKKK